MEPAREGWKIRLMCPCGRNLADVTWNEYNGDWTRDKLQVTARPNVRQEDYRPWHAANMAWSRARAGQPQSGVLERLRADRIRRRNGEEVEERVRPVNLLHPARERAKANPGRVEGVDFDWHDRTYAWTCRCGEKHEKRHERIGAAWSEHLLGDTPIVRLTIGRDL